MRQDRKAESSVGMSTAIAAVGMVVLLVVGAGVGYYAGLSGMTSGSTVTVTSTAQGGGSGGTTVTVTASGSGSAGLGNLTALSKAEGGSLTIYGLVPANTFQTNLAAPFQKLYPWVNINYLSLNTGSILSKVSQEEAAGKVVGDVIDLPPQAFLNLGKGNLTCINNPSMVATGWPSNAVAQGWGCYLFPFQAGLVVIAYNTKLISGSSLPNSWLDLNQSQYKGIEAIWKPTAGSSNIALLANIKYAFHMSSTQWQNWLKAIDANGYVHAPDFGGAYQAISTGGASICVCQIDDVAGGIKSGAPVAVDWNVPQIYRFDGNLAITKGSSHPYTAQLFIQWITGYDGQVHMAGGRLPMLQAAQPLYLGSEGISIPSNHTIIPVIGPGYMTSSNYSATNTIIEQLMA